MKPIKRIWKYVKILIGYCFIVILGEHFIILLRGEMHKNTHDIHYTPKPTDDVRTPPILWTLKQNRTVAPTKKPSEDALYYRKAPRKVNPYRFSFLPGLDGGTICTKDTTLIIVVHSLHDYTERRKAIREAWGSVARGLDWPGYGQLTENVKLAFTFGVNKDSNKNRLIREENKLHNDIVQGDFIEAYSNMTLKSLLDLKFVFTMCPSAKYLLKSDDDMFINVPHLIQTLHKTDMHRSIMGPYNVNSKVYRAGKWGVPKRLFPFPRYPPYESGSAYVISCDIVKELYDTAEYVTPIHVDDVYITGILARILNVRHQQVYGFAYWHGKPPTACQIKLNEIITGTKATPLVIRRVWAELNNEKIVGASQQCKQQQTAPTAKAKKKSTKTKKKEDAESGETTTDTKKGRRSKHIVLKKNIKYVVHKPVIRAQGKQIAASDVL